MYVACQSAVASGCILCGFFGLPAVIVSCVLNLCATCMIGYKAWYVHDLLKIITNCDVDAVCAHPLDAICYIRSHKRIIKSYLASGNRRTRSEKILALFVDSGVLYTALWVSKIPLIGASRTYVLIDF